MTAVEATNYIYIYIYIIKGSNGSLDTPNSKIAGIWVRRLAPKGQFACVHPLFYEPVAADFAFNGLVFWVTF